MRGDAAWRARGHAAKARACSSQGSPHGQAAKAKAWPHGQAAKAKARSQGQGSPHGQAAKAKACLRACCHGQGQGHGSPHGQAAKAWACSSQGMGMQQPRPRQPPMGTQQPRHEHAASKAWASTQQPRPGRACSSQGLGVLAWARWHAPGRRQQGPWGHAGCLRGSGSMSRAWHAPWVGCQGRGMPLGPLEGHGSIWGGCCCQA